MGLKVFAMPSTGKEIANPHFFRTEEHALAKAQRKHQRALDTHNATRAAVTVRVKQAHPDLDAWQVWQLVSQDPEEHTAWRERQRRRVVARTHERIRWRRDNFTHQESRRLVNQFDFLAVEDLSVRNLVANHQLAKSIHDAAWTQFADLVHTKAVWAGRAYVAVIPAYTSQTCSGCGWRNTALTLADRTFRCANPDRLDCGLVLDRDRNAALNIVALGRQCLASA